MPSSVVEALPSLAEEVHDNPTGWVRDHIRHYVERGGRFNGRESLLITTRGRRTGRLRRTALYYGRDGDRYVLVATGVHDPAWYLNVVASPAVVLQVGAESFAALAQPAAAGERARLWKLMVRVLPKYTAYEREAGRPLPVVVVQRISTNPPASVRSG
jgi:deazaflavin-dependent oxidoreductase (nitroreductase family)